MISSAQSFTGKHKAIGLTKRDQDNGNIVFIFSKFAAVIL